MSVNTFSILVGSVLSMAILAAVELKFCAPGDNSDGCVQCPDDQPWVDCDVDPCIREQELGCPLHKRDNPICKSNQCGGCYDEWYLSNGRRVWCWAK